jgi:paraquat-inducible protein A
MEMMSVKAAVKSGPDHAPGEEPGSRVTIARSIAACQDCDALQTLGPDTRDAGSECFRCGAVLVRGGAVRLHHAFAFGLAAIPLFMAANILPLVSIDGRGARVGATVPGAVQALLEQRMPVLATLLLLTLILLPAIQLGGTLYLLFALANRNGRGRMPFAQGAVFQVLQSIRPWTQIEILLFGTVIVFGRLAGIFHVVPGAGSSCLVGYLLLLAVANRFLDGRRFWDEAESSEIAPRSAGNRGDEAARRQ